MEVIVRRQNHPRCASIACMIRHYVAGAMADGGGLGYRAGWY
jgi:hypothetical protein